jgi:hypothetical protein
MTDAAAPAPPPAAAVSAIAREVRRHRIKRTRRAPRRAGGRTAARLTPRGRDFRGPPSFGVEAPSEAVLAIAGFGSFGTPFGLVPTLAAAGAFERPASAGAAGAQRASCSLASNWNHSIFHALAANIAEAFQTPSKPLPGASRTLPTPSNPFQNFPKISGPGRRGGIAGRRSDGLGGAGRLCPIAIAAGALGAPRKQGRLVSPARASFCLQPADLPRSAEK